MEKAVLYLIRYGTSQKKSCPISHQEWYTLRKNPVLYLIRYGIHYQKSCPVSHQVRYTLSEILSCISSGTVHSQKSVQYLIRYGTLSDNPVLYLVRYGTLSENLSCISHQVWDTQVILSYISSGTVHSQVFCPVYLIRYDTHSQKSCPLYLIRYGTLSLKILSYISLGMVHSQNSCPVSRQVRYTLRQS